jgi:hypothetical protein
MCPPQWLKGVLWRRKRRCVRGWFVGALVTHFPHQPGGAAWYASGVTANSPTLFTTLHSHPAYCQVCTTHPAALSSYSCCRHHCRRHCCCCVCVQMLAELSTGQTGGQLTDQEREELSDLVKASVINSEQLMRVSSDSRGGAQRAGTAGGCTERGAFEASGGQPQQLVPVSGPLRTPGLCVVEPFVTGSCCAVQRRVVRYRSALCSTYPSCAVQISIVWYRVEV